jgi:hypothetical protein
MSSHTLYLCELHRKNQGGKKFPILDKSKTMKPGLFDYFLEFDKMVNCVLFKEGCLINCQYTLSEPTDATHLKRYEDTCEG